MMKTEQVQLIPNQNTHSNNTDSKRKARLTLKGIADRRRTTKRQRRKMREQEVESKSEYNGKQQVFNKFSSYLNTQKRKFLKEKLIQYYGKNFPIDYQQKYNFDQQWNNTITAYDKIKEMRPYLQAKVEIGLSLLTMVVYTVTIWFNTVEHFMKMQNSLIIGNLQVSIVGLILQVINIVFKAFNQRDMDRKDISHQILNFVKIVKIQLLTLPYFIGKIIIEARQPVLWAIFEWIVWVIIYRQASKIYLQLRLTSFCLHHEYQTKLMDMLVTIFIITHFIAIVLYSVTRYDSQHNWLTTLQIDKSDAFTVYNYAFYFTVTTIMTVGYGDIVPKNRAQIIVVSFVEIFGIIMFGYMMNEIGYCISSLRKNKEAMDRDLFMVQKLRHHYKMGDQLTAKVRGYLLDSKPKLDQVLPQEQQGILLKLNEEIREDMSRQNMASVVRSSIFFICRWSRSFQQAISRNLTHIIAKPNDILYQPLGKQRVYIIKSGQVHIYAQKVGYKRGMRHPLKSIQSSLKGDISDNCYGYSAAISTRNTKLYAISKVFSSCYYIDKSAFLECVKENSADFEYYHEIKSRIDQAKICEAFQVPRLQSSKHHYIPTFSFLLHKHVKQDKTKDERAFMKRRERGINWKKIYDKKQLQQICQKYTESVQLLIQTTDKTSLPNSTKDLINIVNIFRIPIEALDPKKDFQNNFQANKSYINYFKTHNVEDILRKYDNSYLPSKCQNRSRINFSLKYEEQESKIDKNQTIDC